MRRPSVTADGPPLLVGDAGEANLDDGAESLHSEDGARRASEAAAGGGRVPSRGSAVSGAGSKPPQATGSRAQSKDDWQSAAGTSVDLGSQRSRNGSKSSMAPDDDMDGSRLRRKSERRNTSSVALKGSGSHVRKYRNEIQALVPHIWEEVDHLVNHEAKVLIDTHVGELLRESHKVKNLEAKLEAQAAMAVRGIPPDADCFRKAQWLEEQLLEAISQVRRLQGISEVLRQEVLVWKEKAKVARGIVSKDKGAACLVLQRNRLLEAATMTMRLEEEGHPRGCRWPFGGPQRKPLQLSRSRAVSPPKEEQQPEEVEDITPGVTELRELLAKYSASKAKGGAGGGAAGGAGRQSPKSPVSGKSSPRGDGRPPMGPSLSAAARGAPMSARGPGGAGVVTHKSSTGAACGTPRLPSVTKQPHSARGALSAAGKAAVGRGGSLRQVSQQPSGRSKSVGPPCGQASVSPQASLSLGAADSVVCDAAGAPLEAASDDDEEWWRIPTPSDAFDSAGLESTLRPMRSEEVEALYKEKIASLEAQLRQARAATRRLRVPCAEETIRRGNYEEFFLKCIEDARQGCARYVLGEVHGRLGERLSQVLQHPDLLVALYEGVFQHRSRDPKARGGRPVDAVARSVSSGSSKTRRRADSSSSRTTAVTSVQSSSATGATGMPENIDGDGNYLNWYLRQMPAGLKKQIA
eukprot:TRINITY_DN26119_c1_g3_i2.p1 TRINITY_DN26119_c1_g3~~TRINITY_DN26119_c1_g3_i2.p1  ORF type:complete len:693 (-),score=151.64 TRINITY_DN26119_c1_g3_i2:54-2132(-)